MIEGEIMANYKCVYCKGVCEINIIKDTEKATEPTIEFCPFCGMSNKDKKNWKATKFVIIYHPAGSDYSLNQNI